MGYYLFKADLLSWHGTILQAELVADKDAFSPWQMKWCFEGDLPAPFPDLKFRIPRTAPRLDNLWTGTLFNLYSEKLISVFQSIGARFEIYPVSLLEKRSGNKIMHPYHAFRLLEVSDALDWERTKYQPMPGARLPSKLIEKLVLSEEFLSLQKPITRISGHPHMVIIHQDVKRLLEEEGITGCKYIPVEAFTMTEGW